MWKEIDRDMNVTTFAMNVPGGVIVRIAFAFEASKFQIQFVPNAQVIKNPAGEGYVLY